MSKKSILKSCTILMLLIFIFSLSNVIYSAKNYVYAQSANICYFNSAVISGGSEFDKSFKDFTKAELNVYNVFIGQEIEMTVKAKNEVSNLQLKADKEIIYSDDTNAILNGSIEGEETLYNKVIKSDVAGKYNITLIGELGGEVYFDSLTLNVFEDVNSFMVVKGDEYITDNQKVEFEFIYNGVNELLIDDVVSATFTKGVTSIKIDSNDFSGIGAVEDFSSAKLVLDTSLLDSSWLTFKIEFKVKDIVCSIDVEVLDLEKPTNAILSSNSATFNINDEVGIYYLYLNENSKPNINIIDNSNSIKLNKFYKVASDRQGYDKIVLEFGLNNAIDYTNVLFIIDGKDEDIYKSIGVFIVNQVKNIKINADNKVLASDEVLPIKAVVDGKDDYLSKVEWYINDIKIENEESVLNFSKAGGTYTIYAKIGDVQSNSLVFTVKYNSSNIIFWYVVLGVCIVAIIVLFLTRKKKGRINIFGTLTENIDELSSNMRILDNKFSKKLARKIFRDLALVKERCTMSFEENEEQLYGLASKELQKAYKSVRKLAFTNLKEEQRKTIIANVIKDLTNANDALLEYKRICGKSGEN
ncbi:MAG: hypothetical protein ACI4TX_05010 [Christensenellales bacterium]